jgi:hypothetical protein
MADLYGKGDFVLKHPITADQVNIQWDGDVGQANTFNVQYQQNVTRRYTIGKAQNYAAIIPGRPIGSIQIGRLFIADTGSIFQKAGWNVCAGPATITWTFGRLISTDQCANDTTGTYTATGCYVTSYNFQTNADTLDVIDNITIEFLQLSLTSHYVGA